MRRGEHKSFTITKPIVSIITPCYNGGSSVHRLLNSILEQTYTNIELIFINDGSNDNTEDLFFSYKEKFEKKKINLIYIYQENKGVGEAINAGLKYVTGEYLCWPDSDDYLEKDSIELRLEVLEQNPDYAIVASDAFFRSENDLGISLGLVSSHYHTNTDPDQFMHLLNGNSFVCSGCFMVRTKTFFETHPNGEIFASRRGQNYQILLPIYYKRRRYFLNKPLYNYIRFSNSLSQIEAIGLKEKVGTYYYQREIFLETLERMNIPAGEKANYQKIVNSRFSRIIFRIAYENNNTEILYREYENLKEHNQITLKLRIRYIISRLNSIFNPPQK